MIVDGKIIDTVRKVQYSTNREVAKILALSSGNFIYINFLQVNKYFHLIKAEQQDKLRLHIPHSVRHLKNK